MMVRIHAYTSDTITSDPFHHSLKCWSVPPLQNGVQAPALSPSRSHALTSSWQFHPRSHPRICPSGPQSFRCGPEGGVLKRAAITRTAVDLSRLSGSIQRVICEIQNVDGSMAAPPQLARLRRGGQGLRLLSIADLISYRLGTPSGLSVATRSPRCRALRHLPGDRLSGNESMAASTVWRL